MAVDMPTPLVHETPPSQLSEDQLTMILELYGGRFSDLPLERVAEVIAELARRIRARTDQADEVLRSALDVAQAADAVTTITEHTAELLSIPTGPRFVKLDLWGAASDHRWVNVDDIVEVEPWKNHGGYSYVWLRGVNRPIIADQPAGELVAEIKAAADG